MPCSTSQSFDMNIIRCASFEVLGWYPGATQAGASLHLEARVLPHCPSVLCGLAQGTQISGGYWQ
jgi:hypothetical protein